jgi:hypothetical protein
VPVVFPDSSPSLRNHPAESLQISAGTEQAVVQHAMAVGAHRPEIGKRSRLPALALMKRNDVMGLCVLRSESRVELVKSEVAYATSVLVASLPLVQEFTISTKAGRLGSSVSVFESCKILLLEKSTFDIREVDTAVCRQRSTQEAVSFGKQCRLRRGSWTRAKHPEKEAGIVPLKI